MAADDAARAGLKLIKWLAGKGDDVVASAEDLARFGPNAARVRSVLNFVPGLSEDAAKAVRIDYAAPSMGRGITELDSALQQANVRRAIEADRAGMAGTDAGSTGFMWNTGLPDVSAEAAMAESVSDLLMPQTYQSLTSPLASARAIDILRNRPRYQGTSFLDVIRQAGERGLIGNPRDVIGLGRVAQVKSKTARDEILDLVMNYGMSPSEAVIAVRALG